MGITCPIIINSMKKKPIEIKAIMSGSLEDFELTLLRSTRRSEEGKIECLKKEKNSLEWLIKRINDRLKEIPKEIEQSNKSIAEKSKREIELCGYAEKEMKFKAKTHSDGCGGGVIQTPPNWPMNEPRYA